MYICILMHSTYTLSLQPYYDTYNQCYKNVVSINTYPKGPLEHLVHREKLYPLSHFKTFTSPCAPIEKCALLLHSFGNKVCNGCCKGNLMTAYEIPELFSYLTENGYKIDTSITKMMTNSGIVPNPEKKIICFISYSE